ncbi:MAG: VOC family protein [Solobacterium sp.]|nr:VOC family protein [Solobacterium sp.]
MIDHSIVFLPCRDIEETTAFYHDVLNLPIVGVQGGGNVRIFDCGRGCWGFQVLNDGFLLRDPERICLSLECETQQDVDDYYKALTARGVSTLGAPRRHPVHPVYSFFMRDPSGYTVEIQKIIG